MEAEIRKNPSRKLVSDRENGGVEREREHHSQRKARGQLALASSACALNAPAVLTVCV